MALQRLRRRGFLLGGLMLPTVTPLLLGGRQAAGQELIVYDAGQLQAALNAAQPGDQIVLADGLYAGPFTATRPGAAGNPIVIRSLQPLGAVLRGEVKIAGAHVWLAGLSLQGGTVELAADGVRITRCRQTDTTAIAVLVSRGVGVEIDRNELTGMRGRGISVAPQPSARRRDLLKAPRIHRNHFHDFSSAGRQNVREAIQIGQAKAQTSVSVNAVVELNLFERVSVDPEVISVKSSDNVVRFNTLVSCNAALANRHGKRNDIIGNWLERTKGLTVRDTGGRAIGNRVIGNGGLQVMAGDVAAADWPRSGNLPAAEGWLLAGNEADNTQVGKALAGSTFPAVGTRLEAHKGPVFLRLETGTTQIPETTVEVPTPRRLTAAEVGPGAA